MLNIHQKAFEEIRNIVSAVAKTHGLQCFTEISEEQCSANFALLYGLVDKTVAFKPVTKDVFGGPVQLCGQCNRQVALNWKVCPYCERKILR